MASVVQSVESLKMSKNDIMRLVFIVSFCDFMFEACILMSSVFCSRCLKDPLVICS